MNCWNRRATLAACPRLRRNSTLFAEHLNRSFALQGICSRWLILVFVVAAGDCWLALGRLNRPERCGVAARAFGVSTDR